MRVLTLENIRHLNIRQIEFLSESGKLAKAERDLTEKIENTRKQQENVGLRGPGRKARAIYEDGEFDRLLSIKSIREREAQREETAGLM